MCMCIYIFKTLYIKNKTIYIITGIIDLYIIFQMCNIEIKNLCRLYSIYSYYKILAVSLCFIIYFCSLFFSFYLLLF